MGEGAQGRGTGEGKEVSIDAPFLGAGPFPKQLGASKTQGDGQLPHLKEVACRTMGLPVQVHRRHLGR